MEEAATMIEEPRMVHGRALTAFTRMAGRTAYLLNPRV
jgi:hypothetical protein